jgi:hypothetical protein
MGKIQARAFGAGFSFFDNLFRRDDLRATCSRLTKVLKSQ